MLSTPMPIHLLIISIIRSSCEACALYAICYNTYASPCSIITLSQLARHLSISITHIT